MELLTLVLEIEARSPGMQEASGSWKGKEMYCPLALPEGDAGTLILAH